MDNTASDESFLQDAFEESNSVISENDSAIIDESVAVSDEEISAIADYHSSSSEMGSEKSQSADVPTKAGNNPAAGSADDASVSDNVDRNSKKEDVANDSDSDYDIKHRTMQHRTKKIIDSDTDTEHDSEDDVIDVSSDEGHAVPLRKQMTLPQMFNNTPKQMQRQELSETIHEKNSTAATSSASLSVAKTTIAQKKIVDEKPSTVSDAVMVTKDMYDQQKQKVQLLKEDLFKVQNLMRTMNMSALPDKGAMLSKRRDNLKAAVIAAEGSLEKMVINNDESAQKPVTLQSLKVLSECVQPKTFGEQAMATYNAQKTMTMQSLERLHNSLNTCPTEDTYAEDPHGLKVELMPHQKHALAWLLWREGQKPSGGILADDMGLGKTLTMISLVLKTKHISEYSDESDEENQPDRRSKCEGGTLVVCPASLLKQWEAEVEKHCKRYLLTVELYHGPKRETRPKKLAKHDMVITTYAICMNEHEKRTALYEVKWKRIILDEAHQIRNPKAQTSMAACALSGRSRWLLTGTPIHNKELDLYSLLKFLRCTPFDDLAVWKRWVANKAAGGKDRIHTVMSSIMLRRTKAGLQEKGALLSLPERIYELINIKLHQEEQAVYEKVLIFSRTLFAQYLHQHAEKQQDYMELGATSKTTDDPNKPYYEMHKKLVKLKGVKEVKAHEILVLLLRLRQLCCHPSLIIKMLQNEDLNPEEINGLEEFNILEEMNKLSLTDNQEADNAHSSTENDDGEGFRESVHNILNPKNAVFSENRHSTKLAAVLKLLKDKILVTKEKAIIVSQWTSLLRLFGNYLKEAKVVFEQLDGTVAVSKRMDIVNNINNPNHPSRVLLLSLTAGGVGLNLTGANHMILLDLHWNPQLEMQAQDRIYRVGQKKTVHVYKFVSLNTIEERIKGLQEQKLALANSMLTGAKMQHMKLSLQDLRALFNM